MLTQWMCLLWSQGKGEFSLEYSHHRIALPDLQAQLLAGSSAGGAQATANKGKAGGKK